MAIETYSPLPPLRLGLAGFGTVGGGLSRLLEENREELLARCGREISIRAILVRDPARARPCPFPDGARIYTKPEDFSGDGEVDVLVELLGGVELPGRLIRAALEAGRPVVTANKALLAEAGDDLFRLAAHKGLHLGYEAGVCGGIPIIQALREGLAANRHLTVSGILNGTSNYVLSAMTNDGLSFSQALKQAQELGFAEADPALDIQGLDAAHKLALIIRLAWGAHYPFKELPVEGIVGVTLEDIGFAREFGYSIKLLGYAALRELAAGESRLEAGVFPALVPEDYLLAKVDHAYNAVRIEGNAAGAIFLHGPGAGALPTASAVASDLLRIAGGGRPNNTGYVHQEPFRIAVLPPQEAVSSYYLRLTVPDRPGVLRVVAGAMADHQISVAQVIQKGQKDMVVPLVIMTHDTTVRAVRCALEQIRSCGILAADPVFYRVM
ncbi:MAG: homoserine dehydrogenase [Desulfovibrionaceae bacterium]|nr:homoserine dehydrogenase [Desulfovibrionaceae bacterium]